MVRAFRIKIRSCIVCNIILIYTEDIVWTLMTQCSEIKMYIILVLFLKICFNKILSSSFKQCRYCSNCGFYNNVTLQMGKYIED